MTSNGLAMVSAITVIVLITGVDTLYANNAGMILQSNSTSTTQNWTLNGCIYLDNISISCSVIPTDVPIGIRRVHLDWDHYIDITNGTFAGNNWKYITFLEIVWDRDAVSMPSIGTIDSFRLSNLTNLEELHIHSVYFRILGARALYGLDKLRVLDFSECPRLSLHTQLIPALNAERLANLETFSIAFLGGYTADTTNLDSELFDALQTKPIKYVNINNLEVNVLNVTNLNNLLNTVEVLDAHMSKFTSITSENLSIFKQLRVANFSHSVLPDKILGHLKQHRNLSNVHTVLPLLPVFNVLETADVSGVVPDGVPLEYHNVTVTFVLLDSAKTWSSKRLILRDNKLKYVDAKLTMIPPGCVWYLDLSFNEIVYINPLLFSQGSATFLTYLDLSNNNLHAMVEGKTYEFQKFLAHFPKLTVFKMAKNKIQSLPENIFRNNTKLTSLDLSRNLFNQVTFNLNNIKKLRQLDLSNNQISILDKRSLDILRDFEQLYKSENEHNLTKNVVILKNNLLLCDNCGTLNTITWLMETPLVDTRAQMLTCQNKEGEIIAIDSDTVTYIQDICNEPREKLRNILLSVFISVGTVVVVGISVYVVYTVVRRKEINDLVEERIRLINVDEHRKFVVFLSFSGSDKDFINRFVLRQLQEQLGELIWTDDRELICHGDRHFTLGRPIAEQTEECLNNSAIFLPLISDNYLDSVYCSHEFNHAYYHDIPIILMIKHEIAEDQMPQEMRNLFLRNTRILWEQNDQGGFQPRSTWENICRSILETMRD